MKNIVDYQIFHEISAGGVLIKRKNSELFFAIIERKAMEDCTLPKGHQEANENLQQTAVREVLEETGFKSAPVDYLGKFTYSVKNDDKKIKTIRTVHWFLMVHRSGKKIAPNSEVKKVKWTPIKTNYDFMTYQNDKMIVGRAIKKLIKNPRLV